MALMVVLVFTVASEPCRKGGFQNAPVRAGTSHNGALAYVFRSVKKILFCNVPFCNYKILAKVAL
jgi:hypothetical protein